MNRKRDVALIGIAVAVFVVPWWIGVLKIIGVIH